MDQALVKFIEGMPKVELHLHIEGTLEPELMFELAKRNGVALPYKSVDEVRAAYTFANLQEFLDLYYRGMSVLLTERDFYDLTAAYLKKMAAQNVTHVEIFFDPQGHTERGVEFTTALRGIKRALAAAREEFGITSKLIMSFLRHKTEADAFAIFEEAAPHLDMIDGFGLDSSEKPFPPSLFERIYAKARSTGKPLMAHAGEEGPPEYVRQALDLLKVNRIDHGNRSLEDRELVIRLARERMGLTVCPLSNLKLRGIKEMKDHPLKTMLLHQLKATVNSDDPAYFGGYMNENFIAVAEALQLTREEILTLAQNAIEISFLTPEQKGMKTRELEAYVADQGRRSTR
ncbi:MAG TPA: adenosine deaminase [Verrucomicrobiae bacterium]|nr:adenosine deaminase [Verrucomicrobiae bacterium]